MSTAGMAFVKEHAAGEISPGRLRRYLCDEACSPGQKEVWAEACRDCESACAYGRRFLWLLDAGEITIEGKAVKRQIKHGKGEARKMGQAPKENERTRKTRQSAQTADGMAGNSQARREACAQWALGPKAQSDPQRGSETMSATVREERMIEQPGQTCEQLKAPTDLEIMEALKAENEEMFAKLMAAEGENADMRMEKAADELTILKLKARLYDVLLGDQEENGR